MRPFSNTILDRVPGILQKREGERVRVTVEEIAKIAGVSKATVSRVLNHSDTGVSTQTREKVQRIIRPLAKIRCSVKIGA